MSRTLRYVVIGALATILCGAWIAVGGASGRPRNPAWLTARPYAHRGYHHDAQHPENSLAAFLAAAEAGLGVELDVRLTSDGQLVVFHDGSLERMTGDRRQVADVDLSDLRRLRLLGSDERVPTLREALDAVGGRVPLLIEIKSRGHAGLLEERVAEELSRYAWRYHVGLACSPCSS